MGENIEFDYEKDCEVTIIKRNILMALWFMSVTSLGCGWVVFHFITSPMLDEYLPVVGLSLLAYAFLIPIISFQIYNEILKRLYRKNLISKWFHEIWLISILVNLLPILGLLMIVGSSTSAHGRPNEFVPLFVISWFFSAPLLGILIMLYLSVRAIKVSIKDKEFQIIKDLLIINGILFLVMVCFYAFNPNFSKVTISSINFFGWMIIGSIFLICSLFMMNSIKTPSNIQLIDRKKIFINSALISISLLMLMLIYIISVSNFFLREQIVCFIGMVIIYINFLYIIKQKTFSFSLKPHGRFRKYYPFIVAIILIILILIVGNVLSTITTSKLIIKEAEGNYVGGNITTEIIIVNVGGQPVEGNIEVRMMTNKSSITIDSKNKMEGFGIWEIDAVINESYGSTVYIYLDERLEDTRYMDFCKDVIIITIICCVSLLIKPRTFKKNFYNHRKKVI